MQSGKAYVRLSFIIKLLLIAVLAFFVAVFFIQLSQFSLSTSEDIISVQDLTVGDWEWYGEMYVFYEESTEIDIVELDDGRKAIRIHIMGDTSKTYTGFGIQGPFEEIPWNSRIEVSWWTDGFFPGIETHIVDKPPKMNVNGETFSYEWKRIKSEESRDVVALSKFTRNAYQADTNPKDGILDSNGIKQIDFGFTYGAEGYLYITDLKFVWAGPEAIALLILPVFLILGAILLLRSYSFDIYNSKSGHLIASTVTNRFVFITLAFTFGASLLRRSNEFVHPAGLGLMFAVLFFVLLDEFIDHPLKSSLAWLFRFVLIVAITSGFGFRVEGITIFFLYLMAFLPHLELVQKRSFLFVTLILFIELLIRPDFMDLSSKVIEIISLSGAALAILFLTEVVLFQEASVFSSRTLQLYEGLFNQSSDAIFTYKPDGSIEAVNPGFESLVDLPKTSIIGNNIKSYLAAGESDKIDFPYSTHNRNHSLELAFVDRMGATRHTLCRIQSLIQNDQVVLFQAIATDITRRKITEQELERHNQELKTMVERDFLTNIPNRRSFDKQFEAYWQEAQITNQSLAVVLADVDFFKQYNDTQGHQMGDQCLRKIADVLASKARRSGEMAARYGGEEFAILLPRIKKEELELILENIRKAIEELKIENPGAGDNKYITISLGAAYFIQGSPFRTPTQFLRSADAALYQAKDEGRNCWIIV